MGVLMLDKLMKRAFLISKLVFPLQARCKVS